MKTYEEYKDSGIEWVGKIPKDWTTSKVKYNFYLKGRIGWKALKSEEYIEKEEGYALLTSYNLIKEKTNVDFDNKTNYIPKWRYDESPEIMVKTGDILMSKIEGRCSFVNDLEREATINSSLMLIRVNKSDINSKFFYYVFNSNMFNYFFNVNQNGSTMQSITQENLNNFKFLKPSLKEQEAITKYLDNQTQKINQLIENTQNQIEKLKEYENSLINKIVTKGLNNNVELKNTSIEWIGDIPKHWEIKKLKQRTSLLRDGTHNPPQRTNEGKLLLSVRNVINDKLILLSDDSKISEEDYLSLEKSFEIKENDILLAIVGATIGKVAIVPKMEKFAIQRSLAILRPIPNKLFYNYLFYIIKSQNFQYLMWSEVGFSAQPGIYLGSLSNFNIPMPPLKEQEEIANYLDKETSKIQKLIQNKQKQVDLYKELKKTVINNAVTGKVRVI